MYLYIYIYSKKLKKHGPPPSPYLHAAVHHVTPAKPSFVDFSTEVAVSTCRWGNSSGEWASPSPAIPIGGSHDEDEDVIIEQQNNQAVLLLPLTWPTAGFQGWAVLTEFNDDGSQWAQWRDAVTLGDAGCLLINGHHRFVRGHEWQENKHHPPSSHSQPNHQPFCSLYILDWMYSNVCFLTERMNLRLFEVEFNVLSVSSRVLSMFSRCFQLWQCVSKCLRGTADLTRVSLCLRILQTPQLWAENATHEKLMDGPNQGSVKTAGESDWNQIIFLNLIIRADC